MVQPLRFPPAAPPVPTQAPVATSGPKPIAFAPAPPPQPDLFTIEVAAMRTRFGPERVPLNFGQPPAPPPAAGPKRIAFAPTPPAPAVPSGEVRAAFQQTLSPLAKAAVEQLKQSFPNEYAQRGPLLERQIQALLPLDLAKILAWAGNSLTNSGEVASDCAKLVREFIDTNVNELIADTMKVINGKQSFFDKFSNRSGDVTTKPQLAVMKITLTQMLARVDEKLPEAELAAERLLNKMTSLRVIADVCNPKADVAMSNALHGRQVLIAQAGTQAQLTIQQLKDVRSQVADQLAKIDQLLVATIPAYENAKARR